tara:strand:- start:62 stop:433 length:372 start_codon:yes stop_codon:yes gene_type:complete
MRVYFAFFTSLLIAIFCYYEGYQNMGHIFLFTSFIWGYFSKLHYSNYVKNKTDFTGFTVDQQNEYLRNKRSGILKDQLKEKGIKLKDEFDNESTNKNIKDAEKLYKKGEISKDEYFKELRNNL